MEFSQNFDRFRIHGFWSRKVTSLGLKITNHKAKSYATQHDIVLNFLNSNLYDGRGEFNNEFRKKGKAYPDLVLSSKNTNLKNKYIELKVHTSQLKYLRAELSKLAKIFELNHLLLFSFFLQKAPKNKCKLLKTTSCIYYLVVIELSRSVQEVSIDHLLEEIKMGTEHFTKTLAEKSGIDEEEEDLLGVENMIKVVDLERRLEEQSHQLKEKDLKLQEQSHQLKEKDQKLRDKDQEIQRLKKILNRKS